MAASPASRHALPDPPLQLITGAWSDAADLESRVTAALRGGIRWIQLRAKERTAWELYDSARRIALLTNDAGALFVVNDRIDVAIAAGAGGVHLPENGMGSREARALLGDDAWLARSVHSAAAVEGAAGEPVDVLQFGPIYDTPSKRPFGSPQGLAGLATALAIAAARGAPRIVAVGGVGAARIPECLDAGAAGVALIGAIWDAADVEDAAREAVASVLRR